MILTRGAKRLAVPVIICTILPLAVHFAWRFLTSRWWISAAGLLEALSFLSRDRNFDYFPDDRSTSKKSVFSPVDDKSQLPSRRACSRLLATLLRDVSGDAQRSLADPRERLMSGEWGGSREDRKDSQHSRWLLGYTQTQPESRSKRKACKCNAQWRSDSMLRGLGSRFDRRGTLSRTLIAAEITTARNNPRWKNGEQARIYVRDSEWASETTSWLHNRLPRSLVSITVDGCTWRNTTTTGASRGNVRSCVQRSRESDGLGLDRSRNRRDDWRVRANNACQVPAVVSAKMRFFISSYCFN